MTKFRKGCNIKIISLSVFSIFLINSAVYGMDISKAGALRVTVGSNERVEETLEILGNKGEDFRSKAIGKFNLKRALLKFLKLPLVFLTLNMSGDVQALMLPQKESKEIIIQTDLQIGSQEIRQAVDQYNTPPSWRSYYIAYGENDFIDISGYKSIRMKVSGQGNLIAQLIDAKHSKDGGNWQHGLSRVYNAKNGETFIDINLGEFIDSDPSLDLARINKIVMHVGENVWDVRLNIQDAGFMVIGAEFSKNAVIMPAGISILEHAGKIQKIQEERKASIIEKMHNELKDTEEFKVLSESFFNDRVDLLNELKDRSFKGSSEESTKASSLLLYTLLDPAQNTNLRRFAYYILKDIIKAPVDEGLLEDFVTDGPRITDPIVIDFPIIWYKDKTDLFEYPEWKGEVEFRRLSDKNHVYGLEGIIKDKTTIERVVDRRIMKRLAYWSIIMGIDPMSISYPIVYTETLLGAHPEKTYNIMAIHVEDFYNALDDSGKALMSEFIERYGKESEDRKLDEIIVTGFIILARSFDRFPNSGDLAFRLQGYNGYGKHPWLDNIDMSKNPMMGKRAVHVGKRIEGSELEKIASEEAKILGIELPKIPTKLSGYRINIRKRLPKSNQGQPRSSIIPPKDINTDL